MRVSIIVPTINEAPSIESVLRGWQFVRSAGHEIVLVDGGSSDNTVVLARPLVDSVISSSPGRALQMNAGARAAAGEVYWFLHADTKIQQSTLDALVAAWLASERQYFWGRFDIGFDDAALRFKLVSWCMNIRSRLTSIATGDQGLFVSRALFEQCGGFANIKLMEDIELCKRLRGLCNPHNLREQLITSPRRWQAHGWLNTVLLMWWLRLAFFVGVSPNRLSDWYKRDVR